MDTLFECRYIRNGTLYREFYQHWFFKRPLMITVYVLFGIAFLSGVVDLVWNFSVNAPLFICPFACCMMYFSYLSSVHNAKKRDLEMCNGKEPEVHITIYPEEMRCDISYGASVQLQLNSISKVVHLKNQFVLITEAKMLYAIPKDSFVNGNAVDFEQFLKERGLLR